MYVSVSFFVFFNEGITEQGTSLHDGSRLKNNLSEEVSIMKALPLWRFALGPLHTRWDAFAHWPLPDVLSSGHPSHVMSPVLLEAHPVKRWLQLAEGSGSGFLRSPPPPPDTIVIVSWIDQSDLLAAQLSAAPEVQQLGLSGMELCVGWELINSKDSGMKMRSQGCIGENKAESSRRLQRRIVWQIKQVGLGCFISDFILSRGPSFISDIYSWTGAAPLRGLLAPSLVLRPQQPLWKNPMHLTRIDWLHLCVPFGPCCWKRRAGQLPAAAPRPNMMSSPCSAITGCRWEGAGLLGSPNTKQECIKNWD